MTEHKKSVNYINKKHFKLIALNSLSVCVLFVLQNDIINNSKTSLVVAATCCKRAVLLD